MPTNDERREVAEIMRDGARFSVSSCAVAARLGFDCEEYESCAMCEQELAYRLADLIEPEPEKMCRNEATGSDFKCSECGCSVVGSAYWTEANICNGDWNFCPNCGAKVVE